MSRVIALLVNLHFTKEDIAKQCILSKESKPLQSNLFQRISLQVLQHTKPLHQLPLVGPLFTPPVNVTSVAKVSVRAATDPVFPPGLIDVYGIQRYSQYKSK